MWYNNSSTLSKVRFTKEYMHIRDFYAEKVANRSKVPLIYHIHEGLRILDNINASTDAMRGFCLHPLTQNDEELWYFDIKPDYSSRAVINALEYRNVANYCLLKNFMAGVMPRKSSFKDVNDMLIADKVQNKKDFMIHHYGTHQNSTALKMYFDAWLKELGVCQKMYEKLIEELN